MAFTRVLGPGIHTEADVNIRNLEVTGNLSVGGTITYDDVTNVDSIGVITARSGIVVGSGITLSQDGDGFYTGVVTATTFSGNFTGGTITGDGSQLTGISGFATALSSTTNTCLLYTSDAADDC